VCTLITLYIERNSINGGWAQKMGQEQSAGKRGGGDAQAKLSDSLDKVEKELAAEAAKNAPPVEIATIDVRWTSKNFVLKFGILAVCLLTRRRDTTGCSRGISREA
jgi:hypothetical protein